MRELIETVEEEQMLKHRNRQDEHLQDLEKTKNVNAEVQEQMKFSLLRQIENLDGEFEKHFTRYMAETQQKTEAYSNLLKNNTDTSEEIDRLKRDISRLNDQTALCRLRTQQHYRECKDRDD